MIIHTHIENSDSYAASLSNVPCFRGIYIYTRGTTKLAIII